MMGRWPSGGARPHGCGVRCSMLATGARHRGLAGCGSHRPNISSNVIKALTQRFDKVLLPVQRLGLQNTSMLVSHLAVGGSLQATNAAPAHASAIRRDAP